MTKAPTNKFEIVINFLLLKLVVSWIYFLLPFKAASDSIYISYRKIKEKDTAIR